MRVVLGEKYFTIAETAELLGVCRGSIADYVKRRGLKCKRVGGRKYFREADIRAFVEYV